MAGRREAAQEPPEKPEIPVDPTEPPPPEKAPPTPGDEPRPEKGPPAAPEREIPDLPPDSPEVPVTPHVPRARLAAGVRRGFAAALVGAGLLALFEYVVSLATAQGSVGVATLFRFLAVDVALIALFLLVAAPLTALAFAARPGIGEPRPAGPQAGAPWVWAVVLGAGLYLVASFFLSVVFQKRFKDPQLIAASLAALQLVLFAVLGGLTLLVAAGLRRLGGRLSRLGAWNPFGRVAAALGGLVLLVAPLLAIVMRYFPALRDVMPWRLLLAAIVYVGGVWLGARLHALRGRLLPRRWLLGGLAAVALLVPPALLVWGAHPQAKYLTMTASPPLARLVDLVRAAHDVDRDGYGNLLGENDCRPFDRRIHPSARDVPDNGVDENCNGRDLSVKGLPSYRSGERMAVPAELRRDWNVLLITIDTLRYDHTGFGGYKKAKGRDTTPRLDDLAARSVSFNFAHSTSAGTMASVPAIIASRFFHSGIALGPERRPMPPKILPENLLLGEVMKRGGYRTGAILSHEYFNDWGLEQGFDSWDNSLGAKHNPYGITSHDVTSKAQAWIAKQGNAKWFLWAHYLDPHGRYVKHPGEVQFGETEEDIYDGEIAYTDKHVGKLLDFLAHSPAGERTIVIVTSDHGDGFMEHGFINHAVALYKELVHVPLIVHVPDLPARTVDGPVSNLDIYPTLADLAGIDISDTAIEGESLVPQLVYGRDAKDRVVFAETNLPEPIRAAITDRYKLVFHLKSNVHELYDLHADPWEKRNVWGRDKAGGERMKALLDEWLDRVYFARDPGNQAHQVRQASWLLPGPPRPQHAVAGSFAGSVRVLGWDASGPFVAGKPFDVTVYLTAAQPTSTVYRLEAELAAVPGDGGAIRPAARQERTPAGDGLFPTSKWRPGEFVKETFRLRVPPGVAGPLTLRLRAFDDRRQPAAIDGDPAATQLVLGELVVAPAPPAPR